ncbi:Sphingolipid delta(4)-desaturase DES1 [Eumeta japonica]|uniref:Sphingolipid delta(4)-desaturase DES1 n=1 Tax=Eumeta variegata TaxID=151549 RepID=A0A4C1UFI0_EUMVA|nr:Sphingolipid delta(4)-desaturase DES1 [Eumeta japonica]
MNKIPNSNKDAIGTERTNRRVAPGQSARIQKYPEIKQLFGHDPLLKWVVTGLVLVQLLVLPVVAGLSWPVIVVLAYCFGGVINHSLLAEVFEEIRNNDRQFRVIPHHDNASSHMSSDTRFLEDQKIELTGHPPCSPDLAPNDFNLVTIVKNKLRGQRFSSREGAVDTFKMHVLEKLQSEWKKCYKNRFQRMLKCIDHHAIHEIAHNLAFGHSRPLHNRLFGFFANLPIGIPISISFKKYHLVHHRYQDDEVMDTDLPMLIEAKMFCTIGGKLLWLALQPLLVPLRPLIVLPKMPTLLEIVNFMIQLLFDAIVVKLYGWKVLAYLVFGTLMSMGLHPLAEYRQSSQPMDMDMDNRDSGEVTSALPASRLGHVVSGHYMFKKGFETYSYYGPLNWITFNLGYHNEHHDFPAVPGRRLPEVKRIAAEFYDHLPHHTSWCSVMYDFVMDPLIGPYARMKRKRRALDT